MERENQDLYLITAENTEVTEKEMKNIFKIKYFLGELCELCGES